jgi:hypothetical protein
MGRGLSAVEPAIRNEIVDVAAWDRVITASNVVRESWVAYVEEMAAAVYSGARGQIGNPPCRSK